MYEVNPVGDRKFTFSPLDANQEDVTTSDVYVIDDDQYVFVWFGKTVPAGVYDYVFTIGNAYSQMYKPGRKMDVLGIKQGFEPKQFTDFFPRWDRNSVNKPSEDMLRTNEV